MEDSELDGHVPEEWVPESSPINVGVLAKAVEECGELIAALGRCLGQQVSEHHPVTGKPNREWLEEEIADVRFMLARVTTHFDLDVERIIRRVDKKQKFKQPWWDYLRRISR